MGEREGQGTAFEFLASRSALSKLAASAAANSFGVRVALYAACSVFEHR